MDPRRCASLELIIALIVTGLVIGSYLHLLNRDVVAGRLLLEPPCRCFSEFVQGLQRGATVSLRQFARSQRNRVIAIAPSPRMLRAGSAFLTNSIAGEPRSLEDSKRTLSREFDFNGSVNPCAMLTISSLTVLLNEDCRTTGTTWPFGPFQGHLPWKVPYRVGDPTETICFRIVLSRSIGVFDLRHNGNSVE